MTKSNNYYSKGYFIEHPPWLKFRTEIHFEPIRFIPIHSEICFRANPNSFESIRKKFSI